MKIVILSNSSYSYLWPIINDRFKEFQDIVLCIDSNEQNLIFNKNINTIIYDISLNYTKRVVSILEKFDEEYIILLHDIDILLSFDSLVIEKYFNLIKDHQLDRISFGVYNNNSNIIHKDGVSVCKLNRNISRNFYTPFDHTPSIYKRKSLIDLYKIFNNETYVSVEQNKELQLFVDSNYNFYGIQKTNEIKLIYHRGFVFPDFFNILHITVQGKFLPKNLYYDLSEDFEKIINHYNLVNILYHPSDLYIEKNEI